ncbi:MAG TPA: sulfotransferase [Steroidobacteraceae bacterium]|nr:sulfotransferase [Steroidobacteraceae bacterium]
MASSPSPPVSRVEDEVRNIHGLIDNNRFEPALAAARALESEVPENRDVLYMIAVCQRGLRRIPEALAALDHLQQYHPRFSRLFQERGYCYVASRDAPNAIEAFLTAVNLNPALPGSWSMLQSLYRMTGKADDAATAASHVETLAKLPVEVVTATGLFSDGELVLAERLIRDFLLRHGNHIEGMRLLARIGIELEVYDDAETLLAAVMQLAPDYRAARHDFAVALLRRHKPEQAEEQITQLLRLDPTNRVYRTTYANVLVSKGDHGGALKAYRDLLTDAPRAADVHLSVAHSLKTLGRTPEAVESYREAARVRPGYGDAYWSLANLKTHRFTDAEIDSMRVEESRKSASAIDRYHLCFALGKALEDRGEFAESFVYYERGNALKKAEIHYTPEPVERNTREQIRICTREFFAARQLANGWTGYDSNAPIFIVGLPRSGSTLIEQILASHSQVEGTMELANIAQLVHDLQGRVPQAVEPRYPAVLTELTAADFRRLGEKYIHETQVYRTGTPFFIDKMPNNFRHIGLIQLILPNAKIIDARREPMACCFSNFKQLFASGQEFTYSLQDIGRYYRTYVELMQHWDEVLPGKVLRMQHEDVVEDLEGSVRRLLAFCGLPFEAACLEFWKTERNVRTASSEQVRRPIFKEGLDQWRHFEPWLGPLQEVLSRGH